MANGHPPTTPHTLRRALLLLVALVSALAAVCPVGTTAGADTPGTPTAESVRREIAAIDTRLEGVAREHREILDRIERLERDKRSRLAEVEAARRRRDEASAEIGAWAREAYKRGGDMYLAAILSVGEPGEMASRNAYLARVADKAHRAADEAAAAADDLERRVDELDAVETREREALARVARAESDLRTEQARQQKILASIPPPPPPAPRTSSGGSAGSGAPATPAGGGSGGGSSGSGAAQPQPPSPSGSGAGEIYEITCYSGGGSTASGKPVGPGVAATDPRVIPLGTSFTIEGLGTYTAWDTGGAVKGKIIDIWNPSEAWCRQFGRQRRLVVVLR